MVGQLRRDHGRLPLPYIQAIRAAGGRPAVLSTFELLAEERALVPPDVPVATGLDPDDPAPLQGATALLLPGGGDIDPAWYGKERHPKTDRVSHRRDRFELTLLAEALRRDLPVLAICHGCQLLNVHFGGTLVQHLPDRPGLVRHDAGDPRPEPVHGLRLAPEGLLASIMGTAPGAVNSHHHQGIDDLGEGLVAAAWAEDGVLEAVVATQHRFVVGVQWHPEAMAPYDARQAALFAAFCRAAAGGEVSARSA